MQNISQSACGALMIASGAGVQTAHADRRIVTSHLTATPFNRDGHLCRGTWCYPSGCAVFEQGCVPCTAACVARHSRSEAQLGLLDVHSASTTLRGAACPRQRCKWESTLRESRRTILAYSAPKVAYNGSHLPSPAEAKVRRGGAEFVPEFSFPYRVPGRR